MMVDSSTLSGNLVIAHIRQPIHQTLQEALQAAFPAAFQTAWRLWRAQRLLCPDSQGGCDGDYRIS
jgi:hypothetical protein